MINHLTSKEEKKGEGGREANGPVQTRQHTNETQDTKTTRRRGKENEASGDNGNTNGYAGAKGQPDHQKKPPRVSDATALEKKGKCGAVPFWPPTSGDSFRLQTMRRNVRRLQLASHNPALRSNDPKYLTNESKTPKYLQ